MRNMSIKIPRRTVRKINLNLPGASTAVPPMLATTAPPVLAALYNENW